MILIAKTKKLDGCSKFEAMTTSIIKCPFGSALNIIDSERIDSDRIDSDRIDSERIDLCLDTIM